MTITNSTATDRTHPTRRGECGCGQAHRQAPVPPLAWFTTHYGVPVSEIGEDGDLVALGHVDKRRAVAAFNRHARTVWGYADLYDQRLTDRPARVFDEIRHLWMVNDGTDDDWCLRPADRSDEYAFPATYWSA